jgi:hypothetical protein
MTDELDEAGYRRIVEKLTGQETGEERPASRDYGFADPLRHERWGRLRAEESRKAEPKPEPAAATERWFDEKIARAIDAEHEIVGEKVGDAIEEISTMIAGELDKEAEARLGLEDRVRELEIRAAHQDVEIGKRDVTIARQDIAIAELERRLVNGDRRGGVVDAIPSSMKTIN